MATKKANQGAAEERQKNAQQQQGLARRDSGLARRESYLPAWPSRLGGAWGNPFGMMRRMVEDMDRMFEDFGLGGDLPSRLGGAWSPQVEIAERDGNLVVRADLPGMKQDDIRVELTGDNTLVLEGERKSEQEDERGGVWRSERSYGSFRRTIQLPDGVDAEHASANFNDGVLEVRMKMPEQPQRQHRRIEIKTGSTQAEQGSEGEGQQPPVH